MTPASALKRTLPSIIVKRSAPRFASTLSSALRPLADSVLTSRISFDQTTTNRLFTPRTFTSTTIMAAADSKGGVHNLNDKTSFDKALGEKDTLMVVDCFATWCGPCKVIAPQVVNFSHTYPDAKFYKIDVDEVPDVAKDLGIRAMPTFLLFKNGERVGEVVGANPKALEAAITKNL